MIFTTLGFPACHCFSNRTSTLIHFPALFSGVDTVLLLLLLLLLQEIIMYIVSPPDGFLCTPQTAAAAGAVGVVTDETRNDKCC